MNNHIILVDKKEGISSYFVIKMIKKLYHTNKVGHCGTLDPFASGLLIIGVNQATKILSFVEDDIKEYIATVSLGFKTDTKDITGKILEKKDIVSFDEKKFNEVVKQFIGEINQTPPLYSAIHVNGKKLYEYARNNEKVTINSRKVVVDEIKLLSLDDNSFKIYVKCHKGTYIRCLGEDIAATLNNLGTVTTLRRISIGKLNVSDATLTSSLEKGIYKKYNVDEILDFKTIDLTNNDKKLKNVYNGQDIFLDNHDKYVLIKDGKEIVAIYDRIDGNRYHCYRGLYNEDIRLTRLKELHI